jgi:hypothetical protein
MAYALSSLRKDIGRRLSFLGKSRLLEGKASQNVSISELEHCFCLRELIIRETSRLP